MTKILTSHVGSLPRTQKVVDFIFAREKEQPYDQAEFDAAMTEAVDETVRRQVEAKTTFVALREPVAYQCSQQGKVRHKGRSQYILLR